MPVNSAHGTATWTAENAAYTGSDETFAQVSLNAFKAARQVIVSEELMVDSAIDLAGFLAQELGESVGQLEESAFMNGSGTGQPQGLLANAPAVTAASGNVTSFNYAALLAIYYAVPSQYRANTAWIVSDGAARNLRGLVDTTGQPILTDGNGAGEQQTLFGAPVFIAPDMPAPAAGARSVLFGDFSRAYIIRRVRGFALQRQDELYSANGQVGFRGFERVDGRVALTDAVRAGVHSAT